MINPALGKIGVTTTTTVNGGRIGEGNFAYACPFQVKYAGLLMDLKPAVDYDSGSEGYLVAVPAAAGARVKGWSFKTTAITSNLTGAALAFYPLDADVAGSGFATDEQLFTPVTVVPLIPDQLVGVPMSAAIDIALNAEIAAATGGFATTAASRDVVIGIAELAATNATGAAGAKFVKVRIVTPYTKA
jgi:hypothetical protein